MTTNDLTRIVTDAVLPEMRDASGLGLRVMAAEPRSTDEAFAGGSVRFESGVRDEAVR